MGHVLKNIGGVMITPKTTDQPGPVFDFPAKEKQQRAMAFLNKQLFATPAWLNDPKLNSLASVDFGLVAVVQKQMIKGLLSPERIRLLIEQETTLGSKAYTATEMLRDLQGGIFTELATGSPIDIHRRDLQKTYVEQLIVLLGAKNEDDGSSVVKAHAKELAAVLKQSAIRYPKSLTRAHLEYMYDRLDLSLKPRS